MPAGGGAGNESAGSGTAPAEQVVVVVPELRNQAYVFVKGELLDSGFAWVVDGAVQGYPGNLVAKQWPAPGTRLVDTGAPVLHLRLAPNPTAPETGSPDNSSPYFGTETITPAAAAERARIQAVAAAKQAAKDKLAAEAQARADRIAAQKAAAAENRAVHVGARFLPGIAYVGPGAAAPATGTAAAPTAAQAIARARAAARVANRTALPARPKKAAGTAARPAKAPADLAPRPIEFAVAGAPVEPPKEIPLPARARLLAAWVARHPAETAANRKYFRFQHAWVVTGARFGWWRGAEALKVLVAADTALARSWRVAAAHRAEAESALATVTRLSRRTGTARVAASTSAP